MTIAAKVTNPNSGHGRHTLDEDTPSVEAEERSLTRWLEGLFQRPGFDLPRPPAAAFEIVSLTRKPNARIEDMSLVLEREPLLAGRVLRLANSAMYGATTPCTTLKQALIRIGVERVRDAVMEAAMMMTVIHAPGFESTLNGIRRHSAAVAWLSRTVARHTPMEAENAFLIGLLHDVGLSVGLVGVCEFLKQAKRPSVLTPARWLAVEHLHEQLSARMLAAWGLTNQVRIVAENHHSVMVEGQPHPSVAVLLVAERLAADHGWEVAPHVTTSPDDLPVVQGSEAGSTFEFERALQVLELTERNYATLKADSERILKTLGSQFES